jgi:KEOPS complex subunit Cgi121
MEGIVQRARAAGTEVLVLDGNMVFGKDHLVTAMQHAARAIEQGTNASDSLLMETILYASGERQLGSATKKMGVSKDSTELVIAQLVDGGFAHDPSWIELPAMRASADRAQLIRFGISEGELSTLEERSPTELVLEKVAAVDVQKR